MTQWVHSRFLYNAKYFIHHSLLSFIILACWKVFSLLQKDCSDFGSIWLGLPTFQKIFHAFIEFVFNLTMWALQLQNQGGQHTESIRISQQKTIYSPIIQLKDNNMSGVQRFSGWKGGTGWHQKEEKKWLFKLKHSHHYSSITGCVFTINVHKSTRLQYSATQTLYCFNVLRQDDGSI